jgi:hypothetical protein
MDTDDDQVVVQQLDLSNKLLDKWCDVLLNFLTVYCFATSCGSFNGG